MLSRIHSSHLGIEKCKHRAQDILFWPGMNQQIADMISKCRTCNTYRNAQTRESLKSHEIPERLWRKIAVNLFEHDKQDYLVMVDYYLKFFEISHLPNSRSKTVINHVKPNLARQGIPEIIVSDNSPEFSSYELEEFAKYYGFKHTTTSPRYLQSNGLAERAVQTAKNILTKASNSLRSFVVKSEGTRYRRNRRDLIKTAEATEHNRRATADQQRTLRDSQTNTLSSAKEPVNSERVSLMGRII